MAGVRDGQKILPRLAESELAGWLEKWRQAALRIRTGQLVLRVQEGLPYELLVTQTVDVAADIKPDLARPGLDRYLTRLRAAFRDGLKYGELAVEIVDGQMGPLIITTRERR